MPSKFRSPGARSATSSGDRKSTRLNSSHSQISYAVFCLKKKNEDIEARGRRKAVKRLARMADPGRDVMNEGARTVPARGAGRQYRAAEGVDDGGRVLDA